MAKQIEMDIVSASFDSSGITVCAKKDKYKPELEKHGWKQTPGTPIFDWNNTCIKSLDKNKHDYVFRIVKMKSDVVFPTERSSEIPAATVTGEMTCKFRNHDITKRPLGSKYIDVWCGGHL